MPGDTRMHGHSSARSREDANHGLSTEQRVLTVSDYPAPASVFGVFRFLIEIRKTRSIIP